MIRQEMRGQVLLAVVDMPGRTMNVFSPALMDALDAVVERVERDPAVGALVLTSGKGAFIAGADLDMVRDFAELGRKASRAELHDTCGRLGRLFLRLEALAKPTVAALNGLALGGGLEVAMACRWRLAADDSRVQLGLPEIKLGLLPGAGGTQRLPRLIGIEKGLELLLNGKPVGPAEAKSLGLVDAVVPAAELVDRAVAKAEEAIGRPQGAKVPARLDPGPFDLAARDSVRNITRHFGYADDDISNYPAYDAIVRCVVEAADLPLPAGTSLEMDRFVDLMQNEVAGNMISVLFLWRQKADKHLSRAAQASGFAVIGTGAAADALRATLAAAKARIFAADDASADGVRILVGGDLAPAGADLILLATPEDRCGRLAGIHIARSRSYGTAIEIVGGDESGVGKALALARQLRATPYVHAGERSLLATVADAAGKARLAGLPAAGVLAAQAVAARRLVAPGGSAEDTALADVACVVGGLFPACTGGPFTWLAAHDAEIDTIGSAHGERARELLA